VLSYEQFISGRRLRSSQSSLTHNSLAGSEVTLVRSFLNRILGMESQLYEVEEVSNDDLMRDAFNLGDETENAEAAIASGEEFGKVEENLEDKEQEKIAQHRKAVQRKATKDQLVAAALKFGQRIKERQKNSQLDNHDMLRLRALLMIIAAASWDGSENTNKKPPRRYSIRVLPAYGDQDSWPFVMGRLLFAIFGGSDPAIRHLYLRSLHDQIPDDIIECWATCYWCFQACMHSPIPKTKKVQLTKYLGPVASFAYRMTLPTKAEMLGENVITIINGMSARYAKRIGVDPAAIENGHQAFVEGLFQAD